MPGMIKHIQRINSIRNEPFVTFFVPLVDPHAVQIWPAIKTPFGYFFTETLDYNTLFFYYFSYDYALVPAYALPMVFLLIRVV